MYKGTSFVLFLGYSNLCSKTFSFNSSQNIMKISIDWGNVCISVTISILSHWVLSIFPRRMYGNSGITSHIRKTVLIFVLN